MDRDDYSQQHNSSHSHTHKASPTDLLSSAKVAEEVGQMTFRHNSPGYDTAKAADAAADMLRSASHYRKIEESGYGKYVEKAENYFHQYKPNHSSAPAASATHESEDDDGGSGGGYGDYMKMAQGFMGHSKTNSAAHEGGSSEEEGGGLGGYMKMAQGFMAHSGTNTTSNGKEDGGGGGIGDYMKMAQGFMGHSSGRLHGEEEEKEEDGGGGGGGGGYGEYVKMAEGFMKKH